MDLLQGPLLAAEGYAMKIAMETALGGPIEFDEAGVRRLLGRRLLDGPECVLAMRAAMKRANLDRFARYWDALQLVADDDVADDLALIREVFSRLAHRLGDKVTSRIADLSTGNLRRPCIVGEASKLSTEMIMGIGEELARFRGQIKYHRNDEVGRDPWTPPDIARLGPTAGAADEDAAYRRANLTALERRCIESWLRRRLPPLGQILTFSAVAASIADRYACKAEREVALAIDAAERIYDLIIHLID